MGFLNSWPVWGSLAAVGIAVPVIIHLLYRKHRQQTDWAAMELLRRALVTRSGQVRLENYLILFLRCLALVLVALAMLRPTLTSDSPQVLGDRKVGMVVAVDASLSMNHGEPARFEKAIDLVAKEILPKAEVGDPFSLVLMSSQPEILLRRTAYEPANVEGLLKEQKTASPHRLGLEQNLEELEKLVAELKTPVKECYLVTDGQESDWANLSDRAKESLARLKREANVFVVPVKVESEDNLSIASLGYSSGTLHTAGSARISAKIRNNGRRERDGATIEFYVGNALITRKAVGRVGPGQTKDISFFTTFQTPGDVRLMAKLSKDDLSRDNERFGVVHVRREIQVLCVDDPHGDGRDARGGAYYPVKALRLLDRTGEGPLQVTRTSAANLSLENLGKYDVVLLANVGDLGLEMVSRLRKFVERGGGLVVFLGDRVDPETYNERFGTGADGLLPGKLVELVAANEDDEDWSLGNVQSGHSLAAIVARLPEAITGTARVSKAIRTEPAPGSETVLTLAEPKLPLLLSREVGDGSVLMFTTSADRSWNQLAVHPLFSMLLQQTATEMSSRPEARNVIVGSTSNLPVRGRQAGEVVQVFAPRRNPKDETEQRESLETKLTQAGQQTVCSIDADRVGVYEVAYEQDAGTKIVMLASNIDPAESNVRVADLAAVSSTLEPIGVKVAGAGKLESAIEEGRRGFELSGWLLALGIFIFILQSLLAKYFTNRMSQPETDVAASLQMSRVAAARRS